MVSGIGHIAISTNDFEKSIWFYEDVLKGRRIVEINEPSGEIFIVGLKYPNGTYIELFAPRKEYPLGKQLGRNHMCFVVEDMAELATVLKDEGIHTEGAPVVARDGNLQMWCVDPNGYRVEFMQYQAGCPQLNPNRFLKIL